jgi:hypothetical protein
MECDLETTKRIRIKGRFIQLVCVSSPSPGEWLKMERVQFEGKEFYLFRWRRPSPHWESPHVVERDGSGIIEAWASEDRSDRGGSVYLNSFWAVAKWIPASVRLPSGLMTAH